MTVGRAPRHPPCARQCSLEARFPCRKPRIYLTGETHGSATVPLPPFVPRSAVAHARRSGRPGEPRVGGFVCPASAGARASRGPPMPGTTGSSRAPAPSTSRRRRRPSRREHRISGRPPRPRDERRPAERRATKERSQTSQVRDAHAATSGVSGVLRSFEGAAIRTKAGSCTSSRTACTRGRRSCRPCR